MSAKGLIAKRVKNSSVTLGCSSLQWALLYTRWPPPDAGGSFLLLNLTGVRPSLCWDLIRAAPTLWSTIFHSCLSVIGAPIFPGTPAPRARAQLCYRAQQLPQWGQGGNFPTGKTKVNK